MGEVVLSSEGGVNLVEEREKEEEAERRTGAEKREKKKNGDGSASMVRWERFLPRMVLRVLLVEADDSTRQIIAALLRKCSYRVAAVSDGLKAWEILKGKPRNIDLILTEVDLPSISGFPLLTLIMEHEICKTIPVIMMSWQDSVSMVYKCMLRGAADFLVKPVRKNELRNLWQHVWRRQNSTGSGCGPQDESVAQQKVEATAENNDASNHSSGYIACIQRNRERIEKGSDAQSSCTKPDIEAERACLENVHEPPKSHVAVNDVSILKSGECSMSIKKLRTHDGSVVAACKDANIMTEEKDEAPEIRREHPNFTREACATNPIFASPSTEAIDLVGAFGNCSNSSYRNLRSNNCTDRVEDSPTLDLSLRRSYASASVNQVPDEKHRLNHSEASAFSRYVSKTFQPLQYMASISQPQEDHGTGSERQISNHIRDCNTGAQRLAVSSQNNMIPLVRGQSVQGETSFPGPQQTIFSVPVPVRDIRFDNPCSPYGSVLPPMFCTRSGPSPLQSPGSACSQEPSLRMHPFHQSSIETRSSQEFCNVIDQQANSCANQAQHKQMHKLELSQDGRHVSSATDRSASGSFCNGAMSSIKSISHGSGKNVDQVPGHRLAAESENEESLLVQTRNPHRSVQREAALNKFRLKRKERCYEKKVRYESRKKLAEQRPRVKGQFVRQVHTDPAPMETDGTRCGNSIDG